jgi:hypothetical protein
MFIHHQPFPKLVVILVVSALLFSGVLSMASPASDTNQQAGSGTRGKLNSRPGNLKFHEVPVGQGKTLPAVLSNLGPRSLTVSQMNNNAPGYSLSGLSVPFTLAPSQSVDFTITFQPVGTGQANGTFAFVNTGSNSPYYVYVYGRGIAGGMLSANPTSFDFGNVQSGKKESKLETLTNTGSATTTVSQANVTGAGFSLTGLPLPLVLTPSQNYTFEVDFAPQGTGTYNGSIALISDAYNANLTIPLTGKGTPAGTLSITPETLDFGIVAEGSNKTLPATLKANGAGITIISAGTSSAEFTLGGLTLPLTIPNGQSAPYTVTFTPQQNGVTSGEAVFVSDAANSPTSQSLTGSGAAAPHHRVTLSWNPSVDEVAGYNVYRSGAHGGPYNKLNSALQPTTQYDDDAVSPGQTYYYVSTAVTEGGKESVYSNEAQAVIPTP